MADKKKDDKKEKKDEAEKAAPAKDAKDAKGAKDTPKEGDTAEGAEGETPAEGGKKKLPLKIMIIAGVGAVVLIGLIVGVLLMTGILGGKKAETTEAVPGGIPGIPGKEKAGGPSKEGEAKKEGAIFYDLGEMVVNLNTDGKRQTFLKLVVQLELENAADKTVIDNLKPRIIDNFQTYLRELRVDDLRGSAGLYRLREELLFRVSEAVHPIKIRDVLFQQMLVQ